MVLYTITKHASYWLAPRLLHIGLAARYRFFPHTTNYYWDSLCGLALAQRLTSICVYEQSRKRASASGGAGAGSSGTTTSASTGTTSTTATSGPNHRLQVLQDIVAPAISNVEQWQWNVRFLKWLRQEVLVAKYEPNVKEAFDAYPQLRHSPQLTRHPTLRMLRNLARGNIDFQVDRTVKPLLPSTETIVKAFQMRQWTKHKQSMVAIPSSSSTTSTTSNTTTTTTSTMPIIDLYDTASGGSAGYIQHCGPFNAVCEEANIYQMWTKEYVERLADYLMEQQPSIVLDVGAGDGLLIHFLQQQQQEQNAKKRQPPTKILTPQWIATDNGSWNIFPKAQVERRSVQDALQTYATRDTIVLCSWMPPGVDWTTMFRQYQVQEYILIGEADDGSCGNQDTWNPSCYETQGYQRRDLIDLLPFQFSRFDCSVSKMGTTISFRRRSK